MKCPKCDSDFIVKLAVYWNDGRNMYACQKCNHRWLYPPEKEPIEHTIVRWIIFLLIPLLIPMFIYQSIKNYITIKRIKRKLSK